MKATYKTPDGRLALEVSGENIKALFTEISEVQEIFDEASACGMCHSPSVKLIVREYDGNKYYEMRCQESNCRARLEFGQHKVGGGIFPKRKDADNNWMPNRGWYIYQKEGAAAPSSGARRPAPARNTEDVPF